MSQPSGNPTPWLSAQAACAGFSVALLYTLGNTSFILANGAEKLPYAYLWACVLTPPLSFGYNRLQRVWPVSRLNFITVAIFTVLHLIAWGLSWAARVDIAAYILFISYTLALAFLVIVVTTQLNRVCTTDQIKTRYPIILAVQTVALILCGLIIAPLSQWLGGDMHVLFVGAGVMLLMLLALTMTSRRFPQLASPSERNELQPVRIEKLLQSRLPRLLLLYQFLSSTGTLLIIYLVPLLAQRALLSDEGLTRFFGNLIAGATLGALVFLVFGASRILLKYGVGFGLVMNPVGVIVIVIMMLFTSFFSPEHAALLLGLAAMARALDFILAVGATETSVNAFIKQLPDNSQLPLINAINALAYPLSYGAAALIILLMQVWSGSSLPAILMVTLLVCVCWTASAFRLVPEAEKDHGN